MKYILASLFLVYLSSCLKENKIIIKNDLEGDQSGWSGKIIEGNAHSGKHITITDFANPYSAGFSGDISNLTPSPLKRIDIITWIYKSSDSASANFVISINRNGKDVFWQSEPTENVHANNNEWARMYASYDIPDSIANIGILKVYLWNTNKYRVDADDFEIRLYY